jgi:cytochrome c-type biogenesis protein CcmH
MNPRLLHVLLGLVMMLALALPVRAAIEVLEFNSPRVEKDYYTLIDELRCLVCQNQNLKDSNADLAKDLRRQTYEMLQQGKSKQEVIDYMVARYGDFVLYRPPLKSNTILLWSGPFVLLLLVLFLVLRRIRRNRSVEPPEPQTLEQARHLLNDDEQKTT